MKQYIYKSDFKFGPEATEKQRILFSADLSYAVLKGYEYIQTSDEVVFSINGDELMQVDLIEEDLLELEERKQNFKESLKQIRGLFDEEDTSEPDYNISTHNLKLIDGVINNTLSAKTDKITPEQADTMLKLAKLKEMLIEIDNFQ